MIEKKKSEFLKDKLFRIKREIHTGISDDDNLHFVYRRHLIIFNKFQINPIFSFRFDLSSFGDTYFVWVIPTNSSASF